MESSQDHADANGVEVLGMRMKGFGPRRSRRSALQAAFVTLPALMQRVQARMR